jgi:hypothetical protein
VPVRGAWASRRPGFGRGGVGGQRGQGVLDEHPDNLDRSGRALLDRVPLVLTTVSGAARLGGTARGLSPWEPVDLVRPGGGTLRVTGVPARHGPQGCEPFTGDVIGFMLTATDLPSVYVSGDNASLGLVKDIADRFGPVDPAVSAPIGPLSQERVVEPPAGRPAAAARPGWPGQGERAESSRGFLIGMATYPTLRQVVLDGTDVRALAEFYRRLFGLVYRPGDEDEQGQDWLVLTNPGGLQLAFQQVTDLPTSTWPAPGIPQQLHLDTTVPSSAELDVQHERALGLGATLLLDRSDDPDEALRVYADPAGHPFCIFVA